MVGVIRMFIRTTLYSAVAVLLVCAASVNAQDDVMRVHFVDVGQGDATIIEFPHGVMLVDAGGEKAREFNGKRNLMKYLRKFFQRREDLADRDHPIDLLAITHPHKDHTRAIPAIIVEYQPANVIHNHQDTGSGIAEQEFAVDYIRETEADGYWIVQDRAVDAVARTGKGITNRTVDPFGPIAGAGSTDPSVSVLWGGVRSNRDWDHDDYDDENNHSLVIRVDYGEASILFTGDLEEAIKDQEARFDKAGIERIVEAYRDADVLDVDVYQAGHHGSHNGGSAALLELISPQIAVISCGPPVRRRGSEFNAFNFGHPRKEAIDELEAVVTSSRDNAKNAKYFKRQYRPLNKRIEKAIYCTGWDGTIVLEGKPNGQWRVVELVGNPAFPD